MGPDPDPGSALGSRPPGTWWHPAQGAATLLATFFGFRGSFGPNGVSVGRASRPFCRCSAAELADAGGSTCLSVEIKPVSGVDLLIDMTHWASLPIRQSEVTTGQTSADAVLLAFEYPGARRSRNGGFPHSERDSIREGPPA